LGLIVLLAGTLLYGAVVGQHVPAALSWLKDTRDIAANSVGLRIAAISLAGKRKSAAKKFSPPPA